MKWLLTSLAFFSLPTLAGEGFNLERQLLPESVQQVWDSTFLTFSKAPSGGSGSAFLIAKKSSGSTAELLFLTTDHTNVATCGAARGFCENLVISSTLTYDMRNQKQFDSQNPQTIIGAEIVHRSQEADLALIKATVPAGRFSDIKPVRFIDTCNLVKGEKIWLLGYPVIYDREKFDPSIRQEHLLLKRWSQGLIVDYYNSKTHNSTATTYWVGTTADAINGNSGGPAVGANGEVFGVLDSVFTSKDSRYMGDESKNPREPHSMVTRCEIVKEFLKSFAGRF